MKRLHLGLAVAAALSLGGATAALADLDCEWTPINDSGVRYMLGRCVTTDDERKSICWLCDDRRQNCRQVNCPPPPAPRKN
jgi:hypothetical protein